MSKTGSVILFVGLGLAASILLSAGGLAYIFEKRVNEIRPKTPADFLQVASAAYRISPKKARKSLRVATRICIENEIGPVPSFFIEYTRDSLLPMIRFMAEGGKRTFRADQRLRQETRRQTKEYRSTMFKKLRVHPKRVRKNIREFERYIRTSPEPFFECIDAKFPV